MSSVQTNGRSWARGAAIWAKHDGTWWHAVILRANADGTHRVRYDEWGASADEDLGGDHIASGLGAPPGRAGRWTLESIGASAAGIVLVALVVCFAILRDQRGALAAPSGLATSPAPALTALPRERTVWVERDGVWHPAVVLDALPGARVRVHYQDQWIDRDQDVTLDRVRLR